jgi:hypothetical protein
MEEGRRKRAFVVSHSDLDDDDSAGGGGGGGIYAEMTSATALLRNPPLPTPDHSAEEDDDVQANLAVEIDGKPCDCIYISPTAVDTHKVPSPSPPPFHNLSSLWCARAWCVCVLCACCVSAGSRD